MKFYSYYDLKTTMRLVKLAILSNLCETKSFIVPVIVSQQGEGKSEFLEYELAQSLDGYVMKIDGGQLKECDLAGLPLMAKSEDGSFQEKFAPHFTVKRIQEAEKYYYNKLCSSEGLLNGRVKKDLKTGETRIQYKSGKVEVIPQKSQIELILNGDENKYSLNYLPQEIKRELLESKEIKMIIYFIDEMNSSSEEILKEEANFLLNKRVQGYELPFFVFTVSAINPASSNSLYNRTHFDPSLQDRILKIHLKTSPEEWLNYNIHKGLDSSYTEAVYKLSMDDDSILRMNNEGLEDQDYMEPSLRSHSMCALIYSLLDYYKESPLLTADDKSNLEEDIYSLIKGKIGDTTAYNIYNRIASDDSHYVPFDDFFNEEKSEVSDSIKEEIKMQSSQTKVYTISTYSHKMMEYLEQMYELYEGAKALKKEKEFFKKFNQFEKLITDNGTSQIFLNLLYKKIKNEANSGYRYVNSSLFVPYLEYLDVVLENSESANE